MTLTRWGILGAAKFAREHMGPAIALSKGAELAAIATRDPEKAIPFQSLNANLTVYQNYDELLGDPAIDAIYIPLPNDLHIPWAIKALEAGKHVLVEKPASLSVEEFDTLIAARDASGLMAAEAYMIVHHPQWQKMREIFRSGVLGDLRRVESIFSYDNSGDPGNIRRQETHGGGSVPDIGVYPYGAVRFVTGQEPLRIAYKDVQRVEGVDITSFVRADFEGFTFNATTSMQMSPWQSIEFHGTRAVARLTAPFNARIFGEARLEVQDAAGRIETFRYPTQNQYVLQVEAFQRAISGEAYECPLEFSRGTLAMVQEVLK